MAIPFKNKIWRQVTPAWNAILPHGAKARVGRWRGCRVGCRGDYERGKKRNQKVHAALQYRNALTISARPYETRESL